MATSGKTYLDLVGLSRYDSNIKGYIDGKINEHEPEKIQDEDIDALFTNTSEIMSISGVKPIDNTTIDDIWDSTAI